MGRVCSFFQAMPHRPTADSDFLALSILTWPLRSYSHHLQPQRTPTVQSVSHTTTLMTQRYKQSSRYLTTNRIVDSRYPGPVTPDTLARTCASVYYMVINFGS